MKIKTVHYVNQFYGGTGGEEKAGAEPVLIEGKTELGANIEKHFDQNIEIVRTIVCGDNFAAENFDQLKALALQWIEEVGAQFLIAGPSFAAGRYGMACGMLCVAVKEKLNLPVLAAMNPISPGVEIAKRDLFIVHTPDSARGMKETLEKMGSLGKKILANEPIGAPEEEGYVPRGIRKNIRVKKRGAKRAVEMLLKKLSGQPFVTELPMPVFDHVPPAPAVKDIKKAFIAIGTEGGIVPRGNPDRIESHNASKWRLYSIAGMESLAKGDFEVAHGGYDPVPTNENPNRVLPLDVARACQKESLFGGLFDKYPVTVGNVTAVRSAEKYGREIAEMLKEEGVEGIILTST